MQLVNIGSIMFKTRRQDSQDATLVSKFHRRQDIFATAVNVGAKGPRRRICQDPEERPRAKRLLAGSAWLQQFDLPRPAVCTVVSPQT